MKNILALMMSAVLVLSACGEKKETAENANEKPVVKIGVTAPLTGNMSHPGVTAQKAMTMAVNEINAKPDNKFRYEILFEDDQLKPTKASTNVRKFIFVDKVNVIFTNWAGPAHAVGHLAEQNKIPAFHRSFDSTVVKGKYNFQNYVTPKSMAEKFISFTLKGGYKNIAILGVNDASFVDVGGEIEKTLKAQDIKVHTFVSMPDERNYRDIIAQVKELQPDLIMLLVYMPNLDIIAKEIMQQGVSGDKIGVETYNNSNEVEKMFDYYAVGTFLGFANFQKKIGQKTFGSQYLYDTVYILYEAFENSAVSKNEIPTADTLIDYLYNKRNFTGLSGKMVLQDDGQFETTARIYHIVNGKPILVE